MIAKNLRPSAAKRWLRCTASPGYILKHADRIPAQTDSPEAAEGRLAHALAEAMLKKDKLPAVHDREMIEHVTEYVRRCESFLLPGAIPFVEYPIVPAYAFTGYNVPGRIDFAAVWPDKKRITLRDLKYGQGDAVEAVENEQLAIYAYSLALLFQANRSEGWSVEIKIDQPRLRSGDVASWSVTWEELAAFMEPIHTKAFQILNGGTVEFCPDEDLTCKYCPAKGFCEARAAKNAKALPAPAQQAIGGFPAPEGLTIEQLAKIVKAKSEMVKWLNDVEEYAEGQLLAGKAVPGLKLVETNTHRKWSDEAEAEKFLRRFLGADCRTQPKLVSPAEAEKRLKGTALSTRAVNRLSELITKPKGSPKVAPDTDSRPAINNSLECFDDETIL
jgi:hypothetical protein